MKITIIGNLRILLTYYITYIHVIFYFAEYISDKKNTLFFELSFCNHIQNINNSKNPYKRRI